MLLQNYYSPDIGTKSTVEYYESPISIVPEKNISRKIKILKQLNDFKLLRENWDSYNASPVSRSLIQEAINYVKKLYRKNVDVYFTAPSPSGDILIELRNNNKTIEIEFLSDGQKTFTTYQSDDLIKSADLNDESEIEMLNWYSE